MEKIRMASVQELRNSYNEDEVFVFVVLREQSLSLGKGR